MSSHKTGLIMNVNNLYFAIKRKYGPKRLMIGEYIKKLESMGHTLIYKIAYSNQSPEQGAGFVETLLAHGFEIYYEPRDWSIAMALRLAEILPNIESFVLGSAEFEEGRMLKFAKEHGKITRCFATNIPMMFRPYAECIEIGKELLGDAPNTTKPMDMHTNIAGDGPRHPDGNTV